MQYRSFGNLDWKASALGLGCMRLPTLDNVPLSSSIDEIEARRMIRYAIDSGVNYLDTAYVYHEGQSELVIGKALADGYRERVQLATKLPVWLVESAADFDRLLNEQLQKLQTDHIDFYLLHALSKHRWRDIVLKHDLLARAEAALADGRIRHLGFSFHDNFAGFEEILNGSNLWSFCQIQYNYMDIENQAGARGLKMAADKGLAVVIMGPLKGGKLSDPPEDILDLMDEFPVRRSPVDWALQWLWDQPEVSLVLSGMSSMAQLKENLCCAETAAPGSMTAEDKALIGEVRDRYNARTAIPCSKCNYCMPCPTGVNIPFNFDFFNYAQMYDDLAGARFQYQVFLAEAERSGACIACGTCEQLCPQQIEIVQWMPKVTELLS